MEGTGPEWGGLPQFSTFRGSDEDGMGSEGRLCVKEMPGWRLTYRHRRQVNGAKREITVNCGDGPVKELQLLEK